MRDPFFQYAGILPSNFPSRSMDMSERASHFRTKQKPRQFALKQDRRPTVELLLFLEEFGLVCMAV